MTSRRTFLGLLAAVPVAMPAAVKAATQPKYFGWVDGKAFVSPLVGEDCHGGFVLSPSQSIAFRNIFDAPMTRGDPLIIRMRHSSPHEIPNRLYGVDINADGDVI